MNNTIDTKIRLKVSGQAVDPVALPDAIVDSMISVFQKEQDPFAILSTFAYIFCGLKINDIKHMIILSDRSGTRTASREYIRQKIVATFQKIQIEYRAECGESLVSPLFHKKNMDPTEVAFFKDDRYKDLLEEDDTLEELQYGDENQEEADIKPPEEAEDEEWISIQEEFHPGRTHTKKPAERDDNVDRPGYSASWLEHLRDKLHGWWKTSKQ